MKIFVALIAIVVVFVLAGAVVRTTYYTKRFAQITPYGELVAVGDGKMHVFFMGNGGKTVVLLPGMGVALPSADFGPLMRKLSEKYTVVSVEYFGVGFSSETARERSCENYTEEIRAALAAAGFAPPYVLMPHSISSVYSEYYASKYPEEIEAMVSLDGTSTAYYERMPSFLKYVLPIAKFQQAIGLTSVIGPLTVNKANLLSKGYTEKEISDMAVFVGFSINDTLLAQMAESSEFIRQAMEHPFPSDIPYLKIIARDTYETSNPQLKKAGLTPQQYQEDHLSRIGEHAKYEVLDGNHFVYLNNVDRIAEITDAVLQPQAIFCMEGGVLSD